MRNPIDVLGERFPEIGASRVAAFLANSLEVAKAFARFAFRLCL